MKYHLITFGCQMNKSDSERIAAVFEFFGHKPTLKLGEADLVVINMCSVRQPAVDRVHGLALKIKELRNKKRNKNKKLKTILTGCIVKKDRSIFSKTFDYILDIKDLPNWPFWKKSKKKSAYPKIIPIVPSKIRAFVPVSNGCINFCSYCVVPFTRGPLVCRSHKEISKEIKCLAKKGFKEIWLLGQNINDYRSPDNPSVNFAKLFEMIENIQGNFKVFFLSPNPKNFSVELIDVLSKSKKFGKRLNLPVQSGDNRILKKMNRPYTADEYKKLVKKIREKIPDIDLSTDVIVGFPSETKKQFENTAKLFEEVCFNAAFIAKYSPRPGTAAFKTKDDVPFKEKKKREKILMDIVKKSCLKN